MKNKYLKFTLLSFAFLFCFMFNVNALPTVENKTYTYDYDDLSEYFELNDYTDEIIRIIEHIESIQTNKGLVFKFNKTNGFYFYAYGMASDYDDLNVINGIRIIHI